jgi:hypothetical protein
VDGGRSGSVPGEPGRRWRSCCPAAVPLRHADGPRRPRAAAAAPRAAFFYGFVRLVPDACVDGELHRGSWSAHALCTAVPRVVPSRRACADCCVHYLLGLVLCEGAAG